MGIPNIGIPGLVMIVILALLLFGPSKLPELGRAFGRTLSEFKGATRDMLHDREEGKDEASLPASSEESAKK